MKKLLENVLDAGVEAPHVVEVVSILKAEDKAILQEPSKKLCPKLKKLRQAYDKEKYQLKGSKQSTDVNK